MRTYINSTLLGAFSYSTDKGSGTSFKDMIKPSKHYRHTTYNGSTSEEVTDTLFIPSYPEIFGTASSSYYAVTSPTEGTQFEFYNGRSKIKYTNSNGSLGVKIVWWTGSVATGSANGYTWLCVNAYGSSGQAAGIESYALAPAWAM